MDGKHRRIAKLLPALILLVLLIFSADRAKHAAYDALLLCGRTIIPSLFPFFVLSAFLTRLGLPGVLGKFMAPLFSKLYHISPAGVSALPMGFFGGYPAGANYIAELERSGSISAAEGERLIAFCNNSGPAFIVGVMGSSVFGSVQVGLMLYVVHILAALITGLFFRRGAYSAVVLPHSLDDTPCTQALVDAVKQSVMSIINVSGFIIFFSVLMKMLDTGNLLSDFCTWFARILRLEPQFTKALLTGTFELGSGAGAMQGLNKSPINLALAAALLAWGGLSVHFQTLAVLSGSKIKGTLHITGRLISACIAFLLMFTIASF